MVIVFVRLGLCLASQSTIFSHFVTEPPLPGYYQYFWGSKCVFAQGHNTAEVGIEPLTSRSGVSDSTTRQPRSPYGNCANTCRTTSFYGQAVILFEARSHECHRYVCVGGWYLLTVQSLKE